MSSRLSIVLRTFVVVAAGLFMLLVGLRRASAVAVGAGAGGRAARGNPAEEGGLVRARRLISIPFGFDAALPLMSDGSEVLARGGGGCSAGDQITIAFTVTQSATGAMATGTWNGTCTGEAQSWKKAAAVATPSPVFANGAGEACAFAEVQDSGGETETQDWCNDVLLATHWTYLPDVQKP